MREDPSDRERSQAEDARVIWNQFHDIRVRIGEQSTALYVASVKSAAILNAGAAISILGYFSANGYLFFVLRKEFAIIVVIYATGAFLASLAPFVTYWAVHYSSLLAKGQTYSHRKPYIVDGEKADHFELISTILYNASKILVLISFIFFFLGSYKFYVTIVNLSPAKFIMRMLQAYNP